MFKKAFSICLSSALFFLIYAAEICFAFDIQTKAKKANKSATKQNSVLKENSFTVTFYYRDKDNKKYKQIYSSSSKDFKAFADNHSKLDFRQQAILYMLSKLSGYSGEIEEKILSNDYYITQYSNTYDNFSQLNFDEIYNDNFDYAYKLYLKKDFLNDIENLKKYRFYLQYYLLPSNVAEHLMEDTKNFTDKDALNLIENNINKYKSYSINYKREPFKKNFKKCLKSQNCYYSDNTDEIIKQSTYNYTRNLDLIDFILDNNLMPFYETVYNALNNGEFKNIDYLVKYKKDNKEQYKWVKLDENSFDNKKENYYRDLMIMTIIYCKSINKDKDIVLLPEFEAIKADLTKTVSFIDANNSDYDKIIIDKKEYNDISEVDFKKLKKNSKITLIANNKKITFVPCKKTDAYLKYKNKYDAFINEASQTLYQGVGSGLIILLLPLELPILAILEKIFFGIGPKDNIEDKLSSYKHKKYKKRYNKLQRDETYKKYMMIE